MKVLKIVFVLAGIVLISYGLYLLFIENKAVATPNRKQEIAMIALGVMALLAALFSGRKKP